MDEPREKELPVIVGVRFSKIGKNYYFDASKLVDVKIGDHVVVETSRGWQLGELMEIVTDTQVLKNASYKPVDRMATDEDLSKKDKLLQKGQDALRACRDEAQANKLKDVKVVTAEFSFDEKILSILFTCESEEMPNLNQIKKTMGMKYPNTRVDFHKIGPRDVARFLGGMGVCGFATRCCTKFLSKFESISIRMAKTQGISLAPTDITGMCDRLRCCMAYEHCQYVEALKTMPKRNKLVQTPNGQGKIRDVAPLRECVYVYLEEIGVKEFHISEIEEVKQARDTVLAPQQETQPRQKNRNRPPNRRN